VSEDPQAETPPEDTPAEPAAQLEPAAQAEPEPEWKSDPYLTSGARFVRWNLITLILGLLALGGGWVVLKKQQVAKPAEAQEGEGGY
jgi:hypothetical protein